MQEAILTNKKTRTNKIETKILYQTEWKPFSSQKKTIRIARPTQNPQDIIETNKLIKSKSKMRS